MSEPVRGTRAWAVWAAEKWLKRAAAGSPGPVDLSVQHAVVVADELAEARATIVRLERELVEIKRESNGFCNANAEKLAVVEAAKALVEHLVTVIPPDEDHRVVVQWNSKRNRLELALIDALHGPAEKEDTSDD